MLEPDYNLFQTEGVVLDLNVGRARSEGPLLEGLDRRPVGKGIRVSPGTRALGLLDRTPLTYPVDEGPVHLYQKQGLRSPFIRWP